MDYFQLFFINLLAIYLVLAGTIFPILWISLRRRRKKISFLVDAHEAELAATKQQQQTELDTLREHQQAELERYAAIISVEDELRKLEAEREKRIARHRDETRRLLDEHRAEEGKIRTLRVSYREKRRVYDRLEKELALFDERLAMIELGIYEPHFDFGDSETYKSQIKAIRDKQKAMVSAKTAVYCRTEWTVDGSRSKGQTMSNRAIRLTLRAFNNECEAAIANVRWNNVQTMEKRIERARAAIDKLNESNTVIISNAYFEAKLRELRLTHEYRETLKKERDERAQAARLEREEKRLLQEAKAAEKEEKRYQDLLAKARSEAGVVSSAEHQASIRALEEKLAQAHEKSERAKAMAERTKSGFVYVISNVGSFGDGVFKIGLTRRLDPMDRVRELGDASVPFLFDTHAMIYSDDAPALENALHSKFADRRVNGSNMRKEFFRIALEEVKDAVKSLAPNADFHSDIEAQEYFETLAKRRELADRIAQQEANELPREI